MSKVITIYDAKTNLSKYIKKAKSGTPVYIGRYGEQEVVLLAAKPKVNQIKFGTSVGKLDYDNQSIEGEDLDINKLFYNTNED
jgi:prevent-host-death family protein